MPEPRRALRDRLAVAFVVVGGALWIVIAVAILLSTVFAHRTVLASSGSTGFEGYPPTAVTDLVYATYYYCLFLGGAGFLTIAIGLRAFRRAEPWAWFAVLGAAVVGTSETVLDGVLWSGWWVAPVYAMFLIGAVGLSAPTVLAGRRA